MISSSHGPSAVQAARVAVTEPARFVNGAVDVLKQRRLRAQMHYYCLTSDSYTEAYRRLVKYRVENQGARVAVGGDDLGIDQLQFEFLKSHGLSPTSRLLDIGCGSLRGGQHYIPYLQPGNYVGMDISREAVREGVKLVGEETIRANDVEFVFNDDLRFEEFDRQFDHLIAQSVLTHLPRPDIRELFAHVETVMAKDAVFYATFFDESHNLGPQSFGYDPEWLVNVAERNGLDAHVLDESEYLHPRDQRMLEISVSGER